MNIFSGSCHCGRIAVQLTTELDPANISPRADQCGFCIRHRASTISDRAGQIVLMLPADFPAPYRFGLGITDFYCCERCGVFVAALWKDGELLYGVANVPALDQRGDFGASVNVEFEGETVSDREARRRKNWTPARIELLGHPD